MQTFMTYRCIEIQFIFAKTGSKDVNCEKIKNKTCVIEIIIGRHL